MVDFVAHGGADPPREQANLLLGFLQGNGHHARPSVCSLPSTGESQPWPRPELPLPFTNLHYLRSGHDLFVQPHPMTCSTFALTTHFSLELPPLSAQPTASQIPSCQNPTTSHPFLSNHRSLHRWIRYSLLPFSMPGLACRALHFKETSSRGQASSKLHVYPTIPSSQKAPCSNPTSPT